jgi:uncharacterized protein (DUF362 family)
MERRDFLKKAGAACALAAGAGVWALVFHSEEPVRRRSEKIYTFKDFRVPVAAAYPKIAVARGLDALKMVRAAVDKLGGMSNFIEPGQRVLIKPNVGWDRQPEQAANTNPEVVAAVVRLCLEARAASVVVTDVSINDPYRSFARSGIEAAVNAAGGKISFTTENDFLTTDLKGEALNIWPVSRYFHEADRLINVPVVKNHSLSKCTAAMKNWYGVLGGRRNRLHQDLDTSIADLAAAIRPTLTIMDVTRVLKHNGPTGGNLSDVSIENTIAAGTDEVALDSYCLRFLDLKVEDVGYLIKGRARGIGTTDLKGMNIVEVDV